MSSMAVATEAEEASRPPVKSGGKRKLLLMALPVLLAVLAGGGLWFSGMLTHRGAAAAKGGNAAVSMTPILVDVPDMVTNLDNGIRRAMFIRLKARIEVNGPADGAVINENMPRILDAFQTYLRSMRPDEIHGAEGTYRLREALMNRIDMIAAPVRVLDVLFVEILIQ